MVWHWGYLGWLFQFSYSHAVPKVGLGMSSILSAIELPIAVMVSVILLSETVTSLQIAGIVIILLGMSLPTLLNRNILFIKNKASKALSKMAPICGKNFIIKFIDTFDMEAYTKLMFKEINICFEQ